MYELKTKVNDKNVLDFLMGVENEKRREDALRLLDIYKVVIPDEPKMWGDSIVGFGSYHYKYASGQEGDWMRAGFSPRKKALTVYLSAGVPDNDSNISRLGKFKTGKGCLYISKLEDINIDALTELVKNDYAGASEART